MLLNRTVVRGHSTNQLIFGVIILSTKEQGKSLSTLKKDAQSFFRVTERRYRKKLNCNSIVNKVINNRNLYPV